MSGEQVMPGTVKKSTKKPKLEGPSLKNLMRTVKVGDSIRITWQDVLMGDKDSIHDISSPIPFQPTVNDGRVVFIDERWLIISSERPGNPESGDFVTTSFPASIVHFSRIEKATGFRTIHNKLGSRYDENRMLFSGAEK